MNLHWVLICLFVTSSSSESDTVFGVVIKMYKECWNKYDPIKCLKIQVLKVADKALNSSKFELMEGVRIVATHNEAARSSSTLPQFMEQNLEKLNSPEIDQRLVKTLQMYLLTHQLQLNIANITGEARGKKKKNYVGPFLAALAIKGFFMSVAYKGIAMMSGAALLIGKMALLLSALLGLKKLIHGGHEQTTLEIIKQPHYSHAHTHSVSHEHEGGGGHHYKNMGSEEEMTMQDRIYNGPYRGHVSKF